MGLSWQQGPLAPGAIGRFLVPDPLPNTGQLNRCYHCYQFFLTLLPVRIISPLHRVARDRIQLKRSKAARSTVASKILDFSRIGQTNPGIATKVLPLREIIPASNPASSTVQSERVSAWKLC